MKINRGKDGNYCAYEVGAMARPVVGYGTTMGEARLHCEALLAYQEAECYHHEQSMSHLSRSAEPDGLRYQ